MLAVQRVVVAALHHRRDRQLATGYPLIEKTDPSRVLTAGLIGDPGGKIGGVDDSEDARQQFQVRHLVLEVESEVSGQCRLGSHVGLENLLPHASRMVRGAASPDAAFYRERLHQANAQVFHQPATTDFLGWIHLGASTVAMLHRNINGRIKTALNQVNA